MRALAIIGALFSVTLSTSALSEPAPDVHSKYMRACMADGDNEGYCRCELEVVRAKVSDQDIERAVAFTEADEATQKRMVEQEGPDTFQRLFAVLEELGKEAEGRCRAANPRKP
jgi:hypothetical protein